MIKKTNKFWTLWLCIALMFTCTSGVQMLGAMPSYAAEPVKLTIAPYMIDSDEASVPSHEPEFAVDLHPNPDQFTWMATEYGPGYIKLDLKKTYCISRWDVRNAGTVDPKLIMRDYQLEWSAVGWDGPWNVASTVVNNHNNVTSITLPTPIAARYLRINVTKTGQVDPPLGSYAESPCIADLGIYATNPEVASVIAESKTYLENDVLNIGVKYKADVTVTGSPKLTIIMGSKPVEANYVSGSGTSTLNFRYKIKKGDFDADGVTVSDINLNGGSIKDGAQNNAITDVGNQPTPGVLVDAANQAPTLESGSEFVMPVTDELSESAYQTVNDILTRVGCRDLNKSALKGIAVVNQTGRGAWKYSTDGVSWTAFGPVSDGESLLLTDATRIRYVPNQSNGETATLAFKAWDRTSGVASGNGSPQYGNATVTGGETAYSQATATVKIDVSDVNSAPVLTPANPTLASLKASQTDKVGQTVLSILGNSVTDSDTTLRGIAISSVEADNGYWEYSLDGGTTWLKVSPVDSNSALLLKDQDKVRFIPDSPLPMNASIGYRAWDQSSGVAGTRQSVTLNGGASAYSANTDTATVSVTASTYTVTFNKNGGNTEASPGTLSTTAGSCLPRWLENKPTLQGRTLKGWNTKADGSGTEFHAMTPVTQDMTVYAQWTHVVTFVDGTKTQSVSANTLDVVANQQPLNMRPDFTFDGWFKDQNCTEGNKWNFDVDKATTDINLYAKWHENPKPTHAVSLSAAPVVGGTVSGAKSYTEGASVTVNATAATGYHFVKWMENNQEVATTASYTFVLGKTNRTLEAVFEADVVKYTVTFNKNGGNTEASPGTLSTTAGNCLPRWLENKPTLQGRTLKGWNTKADGSGTEFHAMTPVTQDMTVYAQWTHVVTFVDGTKTQSVSANTLDVVANQQPLNMRPDFTFDGWFKDQNCTEGNKWNFDVDKATTDINLYAKWHENPKPTHAVSLSAAPVVGGTVSGAKSYTEGASVTVNATAANGYHFVKWMENNQEVATTASYTFALGKSNRTLEAVFEADVVKYTVTFNKNGGNTEASPGTLSTTAGNCLPRWLENKPTLQGRTLKGWNTKADGSGTEFHAMTPVTQDMTVYAQWTHVVTFVDGTKTQSVSANTLDVVANQQPLNMRPDFTFDGWFKDQNCTEGNKWNFDVDKATTDINLYAKWHENPKPTHAVSLSAAPVVGGTVSGAKSYTEGASVTVNATAAKGYHFVKWMENDKTVATTASYNFILGNSDRTLEAIFEADVVTYTVTFIDYQGSTILTTDATGAITTPPALNIRADYTFDGWYKDRNCTEGNKWNFETDRATQNIMLFAKWIKGSVLVFHNVALTVDPPVGGSVTGSDKYLQGLPVMVTATANPGYQFENWIENGNVVSTAASYTFTMGAENRNLTAHFALVEIPTPTPIPTMGSITGKVTGDNQPLGNAMVTLTTTSALTAYTANDGTYRLNNVPFGENYTVTVSCANFIDASVTGLTVTPGALTVNADFAMTRTSIPPPSISVIIRFDTNGGGSILPSLLYPYQLPVGNLPVAPSREGYIFAGWNTMKDGSGVPFTTSFIVTESMTVYAQWTSVTAVSTTPTGAVTTGSSRSDNSVYVAPQSTPAAPPQPPTTPVLPAGAVNPTGVVTLTPKPLPLGSAKLTEGESDVQGIVFSGLKPDLKGRVVLQVSAKRFKAEMKKVKERTAKRGKKASSLLAIRMESKSDANEYRLKLPKAAFRDMVADKVGSFSLSTPFGVLVFNQDAMASIAKQESAEVELIMKKGDLKTLTAKNRKAFGKRTFVELQVVSGKRTISRVKGKITVELLYKPKEREKGKEIEVYQFEKGDKAERVKKTVFDEKKEILKLTLDRLSMLAIGNGN